MSRIFARLEASGFPGALPGVINGGNPVLHKTNRLYLLEEPLEEDD
jgi:hypothetical protein